MNKRGYTFENLKKAIESDANWKSCQVVEYVGAAAIKTQYDAGTTLYDFSKNDYLGGTNISDDDKEKANKFLQIVWKSTTTVGFAKTKSASVGMYCSKSTSTVAQFATNVGAKCLSTSGNNVNTCYNTVQREAANAKRKLHGAAPLADDPGIGATLQGKLDALALQEAATW
jgi:hypothetical protein